MSGSDLHFPCVVEKTWYGVYAHEGLLRVSDQIPPKQINDIIILLHTWI